jgi:hypothetical protein
VGAMLQKHSAGGLRLLVNLPKFLIIASEDLNTPFPITKIGSFAM